jgi:polyisoprenoid-binding protein YceI
MKTHILILLMAVFPLQTIVYAQTYKADISKSTVKWTGKKVTGEHYGYVNLKEGQFTITNNRITSGTFKVDMPTIRDVDLEDAEYNKKLVGHLKSDDFFGVEKYPEAIFTTSGSTAFKNNEATVSGTLTIKGIEAPVSFVVKKAGADYIATIPVDRTKYNIRYGSGKYFEDLGDKMIYDEFVLEVKIVVSSKQ